MWKRVPSQALYKPFAFFLSELAGIVFKDSFGRFGRGGVKKNDRAHVISKGLRDASYLLGQNPDAYPFVTAAEAEPDQLACSGFYILWSRAVVENDERVRFVKKETRKS